jgi:hypothetical protein
LTISASSSGVLPVNSGPVTTSEHLTSGGGEQSESL